MGDIRPAGGMTPRAIRLFLIRTTTIRTLVIPLWVTFIVTAGKLAVKDKFGSNVYLVAALPVLGFAAKQAVNRYYAYVRTVGANADRLTPDIAAMVREIAAACGVTDLKRVGLGSQGDIEVSVKGKGAKRKVTLKVGAPLLLYLPPWHMAPLIAFHLAVLDEPNPKVALALVTRRREFTDIAAKGKGYRAGRARKNLARTKPFADDLSARGFARAHTIAQPAEAAAAMSEAAIIAADFLAVEVKLRYLIRRRQPVPSRLYAQWAGTRIWRRPLPYGWTPTWTDLPSGLDDTLMRRWLAVDPAAVLAKLQYKNFRPFGDVKHPPLGKTFDYSWLLAEVGGGEVVQPGGAAPNWA